MYEGRAASAANGCFLCVYDATRCDRQSVEGMLLGAAPGGRGHAPLLTLAADDGSRYRITLPDRDDKLSRELFALPAEVGQRLRLRVYHLRQGASQPGDGTILLQSTHASLVVLEPD